MKKIYFIVINFIFLILLSCSTTQQKCPEIQAIGNMGDLINTSGNDLNPSVFENKLIFKTDDYSNSGIEEFIMISFQDSHIKNLDKLKSFDFPNFFNISTPVLTLNPYTGEKEVYFSASTTKNKNSNLDIYKSKLINEKWSYPEKININTQFIETNPTISADGKLMIFSSDRPGGFGGMDLYKTELQKNGEWSDLLNLGQLINSQFNELTPHLDREGNLWFSTNSINKKNLDIVKCNKAEKGWFSPKSFEFPINTEEFDETSPLIYNSKLIFTSNRPNGCGQFDLYAFDICAPVLLSITINSSSLELPRNGNISICENDTTKVYNKEINDESDLLFELKPQTQYIINYTNYCIPNNKFKYSIYTPCSDTNVIKLSLNIDIKEQEEFTFSKYNIPFFVSGYYLPNTTENLMSLKMKFNYNLIGTNDSTKYIENPQERYDKIAPIVDSALNDAINFIIDKLNIIYSTCSKGYSKLEITIKGYTDPRKLSNSAKYIGDDINDYNNKIFIKSGQVIDNQILSELRAYYTAKTLEKLLKAKNITHENLEKIDWRIKGLGIQQDKENYELLRRTDIEVKLIK